jgi:drug/metabolite transporter (DMT)-like permease
MLTAAGAYVFLDERLGPPQLLGGALILLAALAVGLLPAPK